MLRESTQRHVEIDRLLKESARRHEEAARRHEETEQQMKENAERNAETRKVMEETFRQMKERSDRLDKQLGDFGNRFGEMAEHTITPNLLVKFQQMGFTFTQVHRDTEIVDRKNDIITEVDAFLENGEKVMIVEIKNKVKTGDIDDHIERMEKLRKCADLRNDRRAYLGAVAGVVFSESEKVYALKNGFYVIEPSGDTFNITAPSGEYQPHEW